MIPKIELHIQPMVQTPLTKGFYYLLIFLIIIDLIFILWLVYWFYEYQNKKPNKILNELARTLLILELVSLLLATSGYLIMYALNKSVPPLVGLVFEIISFSILIIILIIFTLFLIQKRKPKKLALKIT
ncbi:MAG: hypothetical protein JXA54_06205 [Candidatus Heimdallarchaeota archaeon]|nr:hypothetical protein [Candidatus Heimdallarchaeota archaeon]